MNSRTVKGLALAALVSLSSACSVSTPVRIASPRPGAVPAQLDLIVDKDSPAGVSAFAAGVGTRLSARGITVKAGATYRLVVTLASTESALGTTTAPGKDARLIDWQSRPRKGSLFDGCTPSRLRAVAIGSQGLTAEPELKVSAELDTCKADERVLDRLADALVAEITRR
ncbi:MAG: hypothetical protein ACKOPO_11475 [Novosphingobium sp.]